MNFSISMYDLQQENGVIQLIEELPHYTYFVFPGPSLKKQVTLQAFSRPTFPWSIECEKAGKTRQEMLKYAQTGLIAVAPSRITVLWWSIWVLL
jgi:hypothetical protein